MDFKIRELINDITQDIIQTYKIQIPIVNINQVVDALGGKVIEDSSLVDTLMDLLEKLMIHLK